MSEDYEAASSGKQSSSDGGQSRDSASDTGEQRGDVGVDLNNFPWDFMLVNVHKLARRINMPDLASKAGVLLMGILSEVVEKRETGHLADDVKLFIQRIQSMSPESRYRCCDEQGAFVTFRRGKALVMDPRPLVKSGFVEKEPLYPDDPVGWIWNALHFVKPDDLPLFDGIGADFQPCPAFNIEPFESKWKTVLEPITPYVYLGDHPVEVAVHAVRAAHWLSYAAQAYEAIGDQLQVLWTKQVPQAGEPDPLYRFLVRGDVDSFSEAVLFFGQASKELRKSAALPKEPQPESGEPGDRSTQRDEDGKRPAYERDHLFLEWYEAETEKTYHSHAKIRDKWNEMSKEERREIAPKAGGTVSRAVVITGIKKARSERNDVG